MPRRLLARLIRWALAPDEAERRAACVATIDHASGFRQPPPRPAPSQPFRMG